MGRAKAAITIAGIMGVALISVAAILQGYNGQLITGSTAAIVGLTTATGFYYKGRSAQARADARAASSPSAPPDDGYDDGDDDGDIPSTKA